MSGQIEQYNKVTKAFHWTIALLILCLLVVGFYMVQLDGAPFRSQIYGLHKSFGITVLCLAILRIIWKHATQTPQSLSHHKHWEKLLSKTIHIVLYVAMVAMPLSGWVMSSAGGHPVSFFSLFELPSIVSENRALSGLAKEVHEITAFVIIGCVGLHIAGALKHHIFDKDNTLKRMGGHLVFAVLGLLLLAAALFFPAQEFVSEIMKKDVVQVVPIADNDEVAQ